MTNFKNIIRVGTVSSINFEKGLIRVNFGDKDDIVSREIPMVSNEYNMPGVNDLVLCLFLPNGIDKGFCLGKYWNDENIPVETGKDTIFKDLENGYYMKFDKSSGFMDLKLDLNIIGNLYQNSEKVDFLTIENNLEDILIDTDSIKNKIGTETDIATDKTVLGYSNSMYQHIHNPSECYPSLADGITVNAGAGSWQLGNFFQIIPSNIINNAFDIHWVNFEKVSENDVYELILYSGLVGQEVKIGSVRTYKTSAVSGANNVPIQIPPQPPNSRISAKLASSKGGNNVTISVFYHIYS